MRFKDLGEITINTKKSGKFVIKELERVFLNRGRWTTVLFLCQVRDRITGEFGEPTIILRRYQKINTGEFINHDSVTITRKMSPVIIEMLRKWYGEGTDVELLDFIDYYPAPSARRSERKKGK